MQASLLDANPFFSDGPDRGRFSRVADVPWQQRLVPPAQVTPNTGA